MKNRQAEGIPTKLAGDGKGGVVILAGHSILAISRSFSLRFTSFTIMSAQIGYEVE